MLKKFIVLFLGMGFIALFASKALNLEMLLMAVAVGSVFVVASKFFFYRQDLKTRLDLTMLLLPALWLFGSTAVLLRIDFFSVRLALAVASALVLVKLLLTPLLTPTAFIENVSFLSAVGIFFGIWTAQFYWMLPGWLVMAGMLGATFLLLWVEFYTTPAHVVEKLLFSLFLTFAAAEIVWGLLFWPLHYLSVTVVFSALYYLGLQLCRFYLLGSLTPKKIIFHSVFVGLVQILVLTSAVWLPHT